MSIRTWRNVLLGGLIGLGGWVGTSQNASADHHHYSHHHNCAPGGYQSGYGYGYGNYSYRPPIVVNPYYGYGYGYGYNNTYPTYRPVQPNWGSYGYRGFPNGGSFGGGGFPNGGSYGGGSGFSFYIGR